MTYKKAMRVYFSKTKRPGYTIRDIMRWNSNISAKQNAVKMGVCRAAAAIFAKRYDLPFKKWKHAS